MIGLLDGTAMCGLCHFELRVHGKSAHGSRPDQGHNAIDCFVQICTAFQMLRTATVRPDTCLSYSMCKVHAGTAHNVLPDELVAQGTIRFKDCSERDRFFSSMQQTAQYTAMMMGCTAELIEVDKLSPVRSDSAHQSLLRNAVKQSLGDEHIMTPDLWMAS